MSYNITQEKEIWKPLCGFEDFYSISNLGRIKRIKGFWCKKDRIKKFHISNAGYYRVLIKTKGTNKKFSVHRLVAKTFFGEKNMDVNHIDGNKLNNKITNLQYISKSNNQKHAYKMGLQKVYRGSERKNVAKLTEEKVLEIRKIYIKRRFLIKDIAKIYNVSKTTINLIINRKRWTHI